MMKKILALAATALFSVNACASYIQYNLEDGDLSGFFVQNEQDRSIAYYQLLIETDENFFRIRPFK